MGEWVDECMGAWVSRWIAMCASSTVMPTHCSPGSGFQLGVTWQRARVGRGWALLGGRRLVGARIRARSYSGEGEGEGEGEDEGSRPCVVTFQIAALRSGVAQLASQRRRTPFCEPRAPSCCAIQPLPLKAIHLSGF